MRRKIEKLEVGDVYDRLTVIALGPVRLQCSCGTILRRRTMAHLRAGLRSCGCWQAERTAMVSIEARADIGAVIPVDGDQKARFRTYMATCLVCQESRLLKHGSLRDPVGKYGCRNCYRAQKKRRAPSEQDRRRAGATLEGEEP